MADAKRFKAVKRPCSERRIQANRLNSLRSTGPSSEGCKRSSQNSLRHGMRSSQLLLPGESKEEQDTLKSQVFAANAPKTPIEEIPATRAFEPEWFRRRGVQAAQDTSCKAVEAVLDQAEDREAREVDRLAPLLKAGDRDALRQLRSFPAGVAYLQNKWTILQSRMAQDRNLLQTQRLRCFQLTGTSPLDVLRNHPVATKFLRAQIGVMLGGPDASLTDVASFLGETPPEGMDQDEFNVRVSWMRQSLKPRNESFLDLRRYVDEAIAELQAHAPQIQQAAARRLAHEAGGAAADSSPEGLRLMGYITSNEKGFDAALKCIEVGRRPHRPGPKRGPKSSGDAPAEAAPKADAEREPVEVSVAVAADVPEAVAAEVPACVAPTPTMTLATEIEQPFSTNEAIEQPAPSDSATVVSTNEAIEEPAPSDSAAVVSTNEAIEEPAQAQVRADFAALEAVLDDMGDGSSLEPDSPEFVRLRELGRRIEATYGAGRRRDDDPGRGRQPDPVRSDSPLARAEERYRRRLDELSRRIDQHFGIDGAAAPAPVCRRMSLGHRQVGTS